MLGQELRRSLGARIALPFRPRFDLADELAQLIEQHAWFGARTVERLDPLESREYGACFFHANDATAADVSAGAQLCNDTFVAEQCRVELAQQCVPVPVQQHRDEQAADEIRRGLAHRIDELLAHHAARLDATIAAVGAHERDAYKIARTLFPVLRSAHEERFALAETLAHLRHLERLGKVREIDGSPARWSVATPGQGSAMTPVA